LEIELTGLNGVASLSAVSAGHHRVRQKLIGPPHWQL